MRSRPGARPKKKPKTTIESVSADVEKALRNRGHDLTLRMPMARQLGRAVVWEGTCSQCGAAIHIEISYAVVKISGGALTATCQERREATVTQNP